MAEKITIPPLIFALGKETPKREKKKKNISKFRRRGRQAKVIRTADPNR